MSDGRYRVFKIDLLSGEARRSRGFPIGDQPVDIALLLNQRRPAALTYRR